jgi:hypothetical protein
MHIHIYTEKVKHLITIRNEIIQNNLPSSSLPSFEHESKRRKLENQIKRLSTDVNHYKGRSKKNRKEKNSLKMLHNCRISKNKARSNLNRMNMVKIHEKKMKLLDEKLNKYSSSMSKIFSPKQVTLLLSSRKQAKWTHGEMGKFITMRYKSNVYKYMRSIGFPFASTRTLQRFTSKIPFSPGILHAVLDLLKNEFENAPEMDRQCVLAFDEMSLEGSFAYDWKEDKIYPPSVNINVYFIRGLFKPWKQAIAYL